MFDMLVIEDTAYHQCGHCFNWCPIEDMRWDDELLNWVCCDIAYIPW